MNALDEKTENLIEKKAEDFEISLLFKEDIKEYYNSLNDIYDNTNNFTYYHTRKVEEYIKKLYRYVIRDSFGNYSPSFNSIPVVFVAMGSFGREELCVYSDLDLMIVYKDVKGFNIKPLMERVLYLAWDAGLKLGHRVHEVGDLKVSSEEDPTIKTAMLESRFLFGSKFLWIEVSNELYKIRNYEQEEFIRVKTEEFANRQKKTPQKMEPNLKETIGGVRDANTLFWISKTILGTEKMRDLSGSLLEDDDFRDLHSSLDLINRARNALHLIAKKKEDRVLSQYQRDLAFKLGFKDTTQRKAERQLMKKLFIALNSVNIISLYYLHKLTEKGKSKKEIYVQDKMICVTDSNKSIHISTLLEFYLKQQENIKFHITFTMALRNSYIPSSLSKKLKENILKIFTRNDGQNILTELAKAEVLDRVIIPFKPVIHLPQFDGYHKESVDTHSIDTLKFLNTEEDPYLIDLFNSLSESEKRLLRIVALFHDIGKGRKKDHSELGSKIVKSYGKTLSLKEDEIERAALLIRYHTLMSYVANKEDIYSEKTILLFLSKVKNALNLKLLYLLTIADIKAVGGVFTQFSGDIIKNLYKNSLPLLENQLGIDEATKRARKEKLIQNFTEDKKILKKISKIESNLFFIKHSPQQILDIVQKAVETKELDYFYENSDHFCLKLFTKQPLNLGWFLSKFYMLNVINMDIFKLDFNLKYFRIDFKEKVEDEDLLALEHILKDSFDMTKKVRSSKFLIKKSQIEVDCEHSPTYAKMTLNTEDKKGLIAFVIKVFDNHNVDIASAKITTIKNKTNDLFLIEKNGYFCKAQEKIVEDLTKG